MALLDAADWAERALVALIGNTPPCYELIVIDNGSCEPSTQELIGRLEGARVERNDENIGYGPANNQGARSAHGEVLVFLNSDAAVGPGWLEPLLARAADPTVGAVAPMLVNEDGTLQQAGALLRRDGGTSLYGSGDDPERGEYGFSRAVDYAAGACLLVDRAAFELAGGFDDVYAPAYFEDVDLCLTLMTAGRRTMYEPRSRVVHAMGASSPVGGLAEIVRRNWLTFAGRWATVCDARPAVVAQDRPWTVLAARDAMASIRLLALAPDAALRTELGELVFGRPDVRATAVLAGSPAGGVSPDGLEVLTIADADLPEWLGARRFHYEAVLTSAEISPEIRAGLDEHQPQACLLRAQDGPLATLLEAAGLGRAGAGSGRSAAAQPV